MVQRYYEYQTTARGLISKESLSNSFESKVGWYNCLLKKFLPSNKDALCLDLACGYGNFLYFLKSKGYTNLRGYDLDPAQVELAKLLDLPAYLGDALSFLQDTSERFDVISAVDFIEHIPKEKAVDFLEICFSRLNTGGILILRTPSADGPFGAHDTANDITHIWSMTANVLENILEMVGFDRVQILDERPQPYKLINRIRLIVYYPILWLCNGICILMGLGLPRIWSRSMWSIAYKPTS